MVRRHEGSAGDYGKGRREITIEGEKGEGFWKGMIERIGSSFLSNFFFKKI